MALANRRPASYKYVRFHLPSSSSGTTPPPAPGLLAAVVEAGKEAVRRSPKHFCSGCDRERTAKDKAKDKQRQCQCHLTNSSAAAAARSRRAAPSYGRKLKVGALIRLAPR